MKLVVKIKDIGLSKLSAQFSRPFVGSHSTLPKRSCRVSGPVCFAVLSLTASRWTDGASVLSSTSYSALQQGQEDPAGAAIANSNS